MASISSTLPLGRPQPLPATPLLRRALQVDVFFSGAAGVAMLAGHAVLARWLGLPAHLLIGAGLVALLWAAALAVLARRASLPRGLMWAVVAGNGVWVAISVALLAFGWVQPTRLGEVFVVVQALAVAGFAELQWWAARRGA
jgi:hypothetical protein